MKTLSELIALVINDPQPGVYNLGAREGMSKEYFARTLADFAGLPHDCALSSSFADLNLQAKRPVDMRMNVQKFEKAYQVTLPTLKSEIEGIISSEF